MKKTIRKVFSVLVAVCLCTSMVPVPAMAAQSDEDFLNSIQGSGTSQNALDNIIADGSNGGSLRDPNPFGQPSGTKLSANSKTDVFGILVDPEFRFSAVDPDLNFPSGADAVGQTLSAVFTSGEVDTYTYTWTLEDGVLQNDGTYEYVPHTSSTPTFTGLDGSTYSFGQEVSAEFGGEEGTNFSYTIGSIDGLEDEHVYRYTVTVKDPSNPDRIAEAHFVVSTFKDYKHDRQYLNQDVNNATSVEGFLYASGTALPQLAADTLSETSPVYAQLSNAAASASPAQSISTPTQLALTFTEPGLPAGTAPYQQQLLVHLGVPEGMELAQGDEVTVFRYNPATGAVEELKGVVVNQTDNNNNPVIKDGQPVLSVEFRVSGSTASLGTFAIGYENTEGSFTVEASASIGGTISPEGTQTYTVGSSPKFVLQATDLGYELKGVTLKRNGQTEPYLNGTLVGNTFTLDSDSYHVAADDAWEVTAEFALADPKEDSYPVTVQLKGPAGSGSMSFSSNASGSTVYPVNVGETVPAAGEDAIMLPSRQGVFLQFVPAVGFKVKSLMINDVEYSVTGSSHVISVLTGRQNIVVEYEEGIPDDVIKRNVFFKVLPNTIDGQEQYKGKIIDDDGSEQIEGVVTANHGSPVTITIKPDDDYMVDKAILYKDGSNEGTDLSGSISQADGLSNLMIPSVLEDNMRVEVSFKQVDSTLYVTTSDNNGGTVVPNGPVRLAVDTPQHFTITPKAGYELGSVKLNGVLSLTTDNYLTPRSNGKSFTFNAVRTDNYQASFEKNPDGTTDNVIVINDRQADLYVEFIESTPPAPKYVTVSTSVAADGGGTVTPTQRVTAGTDVNISFFPDEGKRIKDVLQDGISVKSQLTNDGGTLELTNVTEDTEIQVSFETGDSPLSRKEKVTIHATATTGGTVTPGPDVTVYKGMDQTFSFLANTGYEFSTVRVNNEPRDGSGSDEELTATTYIMKNVQEDADLVVTFKKSETSEVTPDTFNVEINAGPNGKVSPSGTISVAKGVSQAISVFPNSGYSVENILLAAQGSSNSVSLLNTLVNGVFTLPDVQTDCTVTVTFKRGEDPDQPSTGIDNLVRLGSQNAKLDPGIVLDPQMAGLTFYKEAGTDHANSDQQFTIRVAAGYALTGVEVNGKTLTPSEGGDGVYYILVPKDEIYSDMLLQVHSQAEPPSTQAVDLKTITITKTGNGTVSPFGVVGGIVRVQSGESQTFNFIPDDGNRIDKVLVNGRAIALPTDTPYASYTIDAVTQDMRIEATFVEDASAQRPQTYTVNVIEDTTDGGPFGTSTIGTAEVLPGQDLSISFKPDTGYKTELFLGKNASGTPITDQLVSGGTYYLRNIQANTDLFVRYTPLEQAVKYHTVTSSSGANGHISPEGNLMVLDGSSMTFSFLGDDGYTLDKVYVSRGDNESEEVSTAARNTMTYTISNITEDVEIWASFKKGEPSGSDLSVRNISASVPNGGGMVNPTSLEAITGTDVTLTFIPLRGYELDYVESNGNRVATGLSADGVFTFTVGPTDYTITGHFKKSAISNPEANKFNVFINADGNGTVSPSGVVSVPAGGSVNLTMIPNAGYKIGRISVEMGGQQLPDPQWNGVKYTQFSITAETSITVEFVELDPGEPEVPLPNIYEITATSTMNGTVSPNGTVKVAEGGMAMFSFEPNEGYKLSYLQVDGNNVPASAVVRGQYSFTNVTSNHTLNAVFCEASESVADFVTINAGTPSGGTISPSGNQLVLKGSDNAYAIAPFYGYTLTDIRVNDVSIFADGADGEKIVTTINNAQVKWDGATLTLKNVQEDTGITASFRQKPASPDQPVMQYSRVTIEGAGSGSHGSTSFSNGTTVIEALGANEPLDISIIPDDGYAVRSVTVIGADGKTQEYTDDAAKDIWRAGYITLSAEQVNYAVTVRVTFGPQTAAETDEIASGKFTPAKFRTITVQSYGRGSISPHGILKVANDARARFSMLPMNGYELSAFHVDGKSAMNALTNSRTYTVSPGSNGPEKIEATFSQVTTPDDGVTYTVNTEVVAGQGAAGNASVKTTTVAAGGSVTLYFWPEQGSKLTGLSVKSGNEEETYFNYNVPDYTLSNISADTTVKAYFDVLADGENTWTVSPVDMSAKVIDGKGSVSPESATVPVGCQQTFNLFPDNGYEVSYLRVNEEIVYVDANIRTYSLIAKADKPNTLEVAYKDVSAEMSDVTVTAKVAVRTTVNTVGNSANARIWPEERTVPAGTPVTFYIKPDPGYIVQSVEADGRSLDFTGVTNEDTVSTRYPNIPNPWPVAQTVGVAGEERAAEQSGLYTGGATVAPALYTGGAAVSQTAGDGLDVYSLYMVTLVAENKDITANVTMRKLDNQDAPIVYHDTPTYTLTVDSEGGGTVSPVGEGFLATGESENIRIRPMNSYYLESVTCTYTEDGKEVTEDLTGKVVGSNLQITMGKSNMKIHAKFTEVGTASFVHVELGSATDPWGNQLDVNDVIVSPPLKNPDGTPTDFARDIDGTGEGTQFFFTPPNQDTNDPKWVLDEVTYNGEPVWFVPDSNNVTVKLTAGGKFDVKFRELEPGHEIIAPTTHTVTGKVTKGQGSITEGPYTVSTGRSVSLGFAPDEGWMLDTENCYDWYAEDGATEKTPHKIDPAALANGSYEIKGIDRDHEVTVAFVRYVDVTIGWVNGDNGYVTPNTMNGEPLKVEQDTRMSLIVAPYEGYDVESLKVTSGTTETDVTGQLSQSQATADALLGMEGHENFTVKHVQEGMGVTAPVRSSEAGQEPAAQAADGSSTGAPLAAPNAAPALRNFNYAYGMTTAPIANDTTVAAAWTDESNVVKPEERTITVEIIGDMGGTVDPMVGKGYDGDFIDFNFYPDDGWQLVYLEYQIGNQEVVYMEGQAESFHYGPIEGDGYIKVGFDSIAHPGTNDTLARMMRTLKALAQTGDLTAPVLGTLLGIAVLATVMAFVSSRRRRKKA